MVESILVTSGLKVQIQSELVTSEIMLMQHIHAMEIEKREQAQAKGQPSVILPGSITEAFCKIGEQERRRLKVKFDIAYFVATEKMAFTKYPKLCQLEALHGIGLVKRFVTLLPNLNTSP